MTLPAKRPMPGKSLAPATSRVWAGASVAMPAATRATRTSQPNSFRENDIDISLWLWKWESGRRILVSGAPVSVLAFHQLIAGLFGEYEGVLTDMAFPGMIAARLQ